MSATLEWTNLVIRVLHVVVGIGWIGSSFFFVWLDSHLEAPKAGRDKRVDGDLWMVHSGGFYHMQKRRLGPGELPATLHWVKWEATLSWASGMVLLAVVYYLTGGAYLLDASISSLTLVGALGYSIFFLVLAWFAYDQLWKSALGRLGWPAALLSFAALGAITFVAFRSLSGRAAAIHIGTLLGSLMVANVWRVIIPSQQKMVDATARGVEPDHTLGAQAKVRSMHNSYMTFPLLFLMVSSHFPETYSGRFGWAVLLFISIAGALARHVMIGKPVFGIRKEWAVVPAVAALAAAMLIVRGQASAATVPVAGSANAVGFAEARVVIATRCASCHSSVPTDPLFRAAPNGIAFDTPQQIRALSARILERAVVQRTMPFANRSAMTEAEREMLKRWIEAGSPLR